MEPNLVKKIISTSLILLIGVCIGTTNCNAAEKDKNIGIPKNPQKDVNDVFTIRKIDSIQNFLGYYWLDDKNLLGIKDGTKTKGIPNVCIYNTKSNSFETLSKNIDRNEKIYLDMEGITKQKRYVLYRKTIKNNNKVHIYLLDLKTKTEKKIDKINDTRWNLVSFTDENEIIGIEDLKIYIYNFNGSKTQINLPKELLYKMNDFSKLTFDQYFKKATNGKKINEELKKRCKKSYESQKQNNKIQRILKKGDEIYMQTYNDVPFLYNLKTNNYKELSKSEVEKFCYKEVEKNKAKRKDIEKNIEMKKNEENKNYELWELDSNGKQKKLIAKYPGIIHYEVSPDKSKVVYSTPLDNIDEANIFVYDLNLGKSTKVFQKPRGGICWNNTSKKFYMRSTRYIATTAEEATNPENYWVTLVVTLN